MSTISDTHDIHCNCNQPFAHLLDSIFPEGHIDRNKTIKDIITRDYQQCHSGGIEEESHGIKLGGSAATLAQELKQEDIEENIDSLFAAAAAAAEEGTR